MNLRCEGVSCSVWDLTKKKSDQHCLLKVVESASRGIIFNELALQITHIELDFYLAPYAKLS